MTVFKKLICKSVKEDYDAATTRAQYEPKDPRKRIRKQKMHVIPEQVGITVQHPEFDNLSENDFVVNAVRKTLNHRSANKNKQKKRGRAKNNNSDVDSTSTASSITIDINGNRIEKYYYGMGDVDESDAISDEGQRAVAGGVSRILGLVPDSSQCTSMANYKSTKPEEDEGEGYLEQCMGMIADLMVGEPAVPRDETKRNEISNTVEIDDHDTYMDASNFMNDSVPNYDLEEDESTFFKTVSSQNTYTDESSRDSFSSGGQSSYDDASTRYENNLFCSP